MEPVEKYIDIEKAIRNSDSKFFKSLPGFAVKWIARFIKQDAMNVSIHRSRHLMGIPFINDLLEGWKVDVSIVGGENIPQTGRFIFVANHPVGAIDALSFFNVAGKYFTDVKSPSNQLLNNISNLRPLIVGLNVFGRQAKETATKLNELFESDSQIIIFPSGEVSRRRKGKISDPVWQKSFITKAIEHKRDIIPFHITGRNSNTFYLISNLRTFLGIKMYIETILLPREMMSQRGKPVTVTVGKVIQHQSLTAIHSHAEWAQKVKETVYSLDKK